MGFLSKVEVLARIITKPKSNKLVPLTKKGQKGCRVQPSTGAEQVGFTQLTETKKLTPLIKREIETTDPFNFQNETWSRFVKNVAPKLLVALMLDMNIVPNSRKAEFARYLERKLRSLSK
jgi:hypothetical protein